MTRLVKTRFGVPGSKTTRGGLVLQKFKIFGGFLTFFALLNKCSRVTGGMFYSNCTTSGSCADTGLTDDEAHTLR